MSEVWYDDRPCVSEVCRGLTRKYKINTMTTGSGDVIARVERCTYCGFDPARLTKDPQQPDESA